METSGLIAPEATFRFRVSAEDAGARIDSYTSKQFTLYSRSFFQRLIESKLIVLNGVIVEKSSHPVKEGDEVIVTFPPAREVPKEATEKQDLGVKIVFTHDHFLIIDKPAGLMVHPPHPENKDVTLVDWLVHNYAEIGSVGYADRPGIIHRLDKDTSGLLIIPRTNYAHMKFGSMFRERSIHKTYIAVTQKHTEPEGSIELPIGRDPVMKVRMKTFERAHEHGPRGEKIRAALTHYKAKEYLKDATVVEAKPVTGRTHQIRVHLAAIGHPIIGDVLYGKKSKHIGRQALHAAELSFVFDGTLHTFKSELPQDMKSLIEHAQKHELNIQK